MSEVLLPDLLTPCPPDTVYEALKVAWPPMSVGPWSRAPLILLTAHIGLETGWGHYMHRWNVGNRKYVPGCGHDYTMFRCSEVVNGKEVFYDPPSPVCRFEAYDSLPEGLDRYLLSLRSGFRSAWPFVLAADVPGFCHALHVAGYYTANEASYTAGVVGCDASLQHTLPPDPDPAAAASAGIAAAMAEVFELDGPDDAA